MIPVKHKTSRRFEQFPHVGIWFRNCLEYLRDERKYLREKSANLLDQVDSKRIEARDLETAIDTQTAIRNQARGIARDEPGDAAHNVALEVAEVMLDELATRLLQQRQRVPLAQEWQHAIARVYYDMSLVMRLVGLSLNPQSRGVPTEDVPPGLCRDILELTMARLEYTVESFEILQNLDEERQRAHLDYWQTFAERFYGTELTNSLVDGELTQPQTWNGIRNKADIEQGVARRFWVSVLETVKTVDADGNNSAFMAFLSRNQNLTRPLPIDLPAQADASLGVDVIGRVGVRRDPTEPQVSAFTRLYDFFVSPNIGPKFESPSDADNPHPQVGRRWLEPKLTFLGKVNTLVQNHFSETDMDDFLQTCHKRRLLFSYSCRLKIVTSIERGWGAINTSRIDGAPRTIEIPPNQQWDNYGNLLKQHHNTLFLRLMGSGYYRDMTLDHLWQITQDMGQRLQIPTLSLAQFTEFCNYCNNCGILFL